MTRSAHHIFLSLCLALAPGWTLAQANSAERLQQEWSQIRNYPVAVIDKVKYQEFLLLNKIDKHSPEPQRALALYSYLKKNHSLELPPQEIYSILSEAEDPHSAIAKALYHDPITMTQVKACIVVPVAPSADNTSATLRFLGVETLQSKIYEGVDLAPLVNLIPRDQLELFSLYHEFSHCLDTQFYPRSLVDVESPHAKHQAEVFAETLALLLLAKNEGLHSLGPARAQLRALYYRYYGQAIAQSEPQFFARPLKYEGTIYFLSHPLLKAQELIDNKLLEIKDLSLDELIALAKQITQDHGFSSFGFNALHMTLEQSPEQALTHYQKLASKNPKMFQPALNELERSLDYLNKHLPQPTGSEK